MVWSEQETEFPFETNKFLVGSDEVNSLCKYQNRTVNVFIKQNEPPIQAVTRCNSEEDQQDVGRKLGM